jgi:hypothetical membrane protein
MDDLISFLRRYYAASGLTGAGVVALFSLVAALFYTGPSGERYSLLNHFISELGQVGVSPLAWLFNLGLIIGGLLFLPFSLGLGLTLRSWVGGLGAAAGAGAALALAAVGLFPMNNLDPHVTAALTYFRLGLVTVVVFGLAIQLQPRNRVVVRRWANLASLAAAGSYLAFIVFMTRMPLTGANPLDPAFHSGRPGVWPLAVLEWAVFFSTIAWFAAIAWAGRDTTLGFLLESRIKLC